jgi:hypothetical protein
MRDTPEYLIIEALVATSSTHLILGRHCANISKLVTEKDWLVT